jgi:tRNA A-37 threonylcarbamoyl transferase component Bud32
MAESSTILKSVGKYALVREVGRGGSAVVYEAFDTQLQRRVALKVLERRPDADPAARKLEEERFLRETQLAARLPKHPHVVSVYEAGVEKGRRYLAMEFVDGGSLADAGLPPRRAIEVLRDAARAVHHAHRHGIVHRDLKPGNILLDSAGTPRVTDFGLAKAVGEDVQASLTAPGTAVGTPAYMAPEQAQGRKDADHRVDVYALGVVLYELIAGRRPFDGSSALEIMLKVVKSKAPPPSSCAEPTADAGAFRGLDAVCLKAMAKRVDERYPSAEAFAKDLDLWLAGQELRVDLPRSTRRIAILRRPSRSAAALAVAGVAAVVWLLLFFFIGFSKERRLRAELEAKARKVEAPAPHGWQALPEPGTLRPGALAEVFDGVNFNSLVARRVDERIEFDWSTGPGPTGGADHWSLRWTGWFRAPRTGVYRFETRADDGVRLFVDRRPLLAAWVLRGVSTDSASCELQEGWHELVLEYFENTHTASVALGWDGGTGASIGSVPLFHDPAAVEPVRPPEGSGPGSVPGAQEGERLRILAGAEASHLMGYNDRWKGRWSGKHLWWGRGAKPGDALRVEFVSPKAGPGTLVLALTRTADHGIFKVAVNGRVVAEALDLYSPHLATGPLEFPGVELRAGANELSFEVAASNPAAREWVPGKGVHKLGLDYVLTK